MKSLPNTDNYTKHMNLLTLAELEQMLLPGLLFVYPLTGNTQLLEVYQQ